MSRHRFWGRLERTEEDIELLTTGEVVAISSGQKGIRSLNQYKSHGRPSATELFISVFVFYSLDSPKSNYIL